MLGGALHHTVTITGAKACHREHPFLRLAERPYREPGARDLSQLHRFPLPGVLQQLLFETIDRVQCLASCRGGGTLEGRIDRRC